MVALRVGLKRTLWACALGVAGYLEMGWASQADQVVPLAEHPDIGVWVEHYASLERTAQMRQVAIWSVAAAAATYWAYKMLIPASSPLDPAQIPEQGDAALEYLKDAGFKKYLADAYGAYQAANSTPWNKVLYWSKNTISGMGASFATTVAYQIVVSPWVSLFNGPLFKKIYAYARTEVPVQIGYCWWLTEQAPRRGDKPEDIAPFTYQVRLPNTAWWFVQQVKVLEQAYELHDHLMFEQAAIKIYAQLAYVRDNHLEIDFDKGYMGTLMEQFARGIDRVRFDMMVRAHYEDCKKVLRQVRLMEPYQLIGSLF